MIEVADEREAIVRVAAGTESWSIGELDTSYRCAAVYDTDCCEIVAHDCDVGQLIGWPHVLIAPDPCHLLAADSNDMV